MAEISKLPENLIGKEDQARLESYGGHELALGRATRFHWARNEQGSPLFEIYRGGQEESLAVRIGRDRNRDEFWAEDPIGKLIVSGTLEHVMATLDKMLAREHDRGEPA